MYSMEDYLAMKNEKIMPETKGKIFKHVGMETVNSESGQAAFKYEVLAGDRYVSSFGFF